MFVYQSVGVKGHDTDRLRCWHKWRPGCFSVLFGLPQRKLHGFGPALALAFRSRFVKTHGISGKIEAAAAGVDNGCTKFFYEEIVAYTLGCPPPRMPVANEGL